jgi:hypothetical protein
MDSLPARCLWWQGNENNIQFDVIAFKASFCYIAPVKAEAESDFDSGEYVRLRLLAHWKGGIEQCQWIRPTEVPGRTHDLKSYRAN